MYPSEWLSFFFYYLAWSHGWLIALIAEEAGRRSCFCVCVCVSYIFFLFLRDGFAMDIETDKNSGWKCEMTIVMPASYHRTGQARKQMWQVSDGDLWGAIETAKLECVCVSVTLNARFTSGMVQPTGKRPGDQLMEGGVAQKIKDSRAGIRKKKALQPVKPAHTIQPTRTRKATAAVHYSFSIQK